MAQGPFYLMDRAILKLNDGTIDPDTHTLKAILCGASQTLSRTFTGTSTDCRYADLTGQLSTANGYTAGGVTLTVALTRSSVNVVKVGVSAFSWTLTSTGVVFKYCVIYDDSSTNKDIIAYCDMDDTSTSTTVTAIAGFLTITPHASGLYTATQP